MMWLLMVALFGSAVADFNWGDPNCGTSTFDDAGVDQNPPDRRIVGGWETRPHEFPWMGSLRWSQGANPSHSCGCIVVDEYHVITAAHCTDDYPQGQFRVAVGEHLRDQENEYKLVLNLESYIQHPDYDDYLLSADICVIELPVALNYSTGIRPVCKPRNVDYANIMTVTSGWGAEADSGSGQSNVHRYVNLPTITNDACKVNCSCDPDWIADDMICANPGWEDMPRDSCWGDSGGQLSYKTENGQFEVVGLVSWGWVCGGDRPGVYARVSTYVDWVDEVIEANRVKREMKNRS